jgi:hypothetical protein
MEIVQSSPQSTDVDIQSKFEEFRQQAAEWKEKAFAITVTDESQTQAIEQATEAHKLISKVRIGIEKRRKELKEDSLRTGKMIDSVAKTLSDEIEPIETHLKTQKEFAEIQAKKRYDAMKAERVARLQPWIVQDANTLPLGEMESDAFEMMLMGYKEAHTRRTADEARLKAEREEKAKAEAEERDRIKAENDRLMAEKIADQQRQQIKDSRINRLSWAGFVFNEGAYAVGPLVIEIDEIMDFSDDEFQSLVTTGRAEFDRLAAIEQRKKDEAAAILRQEQQARAKLECEAREREAKEEANRKAEAAAARKAKRAPDRVKLLSWIAQFEAIEDPKVKDEDAQKIVARAQAALVELLLKIKKVAEDL